jgi:ELWxxDGT repeat protein
MQKLTTVKALAYSLAVLFGTATLSACGGGSSSSNDDGSSAQNVAPIILQLSIQNTASEQSFLNSVLTLSYQYSDAESDLEGVSVIQWLRAGEPVEGEDGLTYTASTDDLGKEIQAKVTPVALTGEITGQPLTSRGIVIENSAPQIQQLTLLDVNGNEAFAGDVLTASYHYVDLEGDAEGETKVRWLRDDDIITGASELNYTLTTDDLEKEISIEVKPVALTGATDGAAVTATPISAYQKEFLSITEVSSSTNDFELWQLSGSGKLSLVKDINPTKSSRIHSIIPFGNQYIFLADDGVHGIEPWITDGTEGNTRLLKDIRIGVETSAYSLYPNKIIDNKFYFIADDGIHGQELWVTDGTKDGTILLADVNGSELSSAIDNFIKFNGMLLFSAADSTHGKELWRSDGTPEGTSILKDIRAGNENGIGYVTEEEVSFYKNEMYFSAYQSGLWKTDGTSAGTQLVKSQLSNSLTSVILGEKYTLLSDDRMCIFYATELSRDSNKYSYTLHCLNESEGDLVEFDLGVELASNKDLLVYDGLLYVIATASDNKEGLYVFDSSLTSKRLLIEDSNITEFEIHTKFKGKLMVNINRNNLWIVGNDLGDSILLHDNIYIYNGMKNTHIEYGGKLYFSAAHYGVWEVDMWVSDGTLEGTTIHKLLNTAEKGSYPSDYHKLGGKFYFFTDRYNDSYTPTLFSSDGTVAGTLPVTQDNSIFQREHIK